ncbi:hypothetical protein BN59_02226 [Legionella massiliensis]|uniref:DUF350 domain-containing protein n=1 Tax=Legionella massiliensis TaxID=1034943 RepID=A0A078KY42_9GAMM|nr:hypothetical protein [Legionella massiliensis]CDZ77932.1 hypothetical protein BN59_02226 [Legionella massiliensis]CEE13670.1 hypothetical protein BN1094_02226 [Legionella massiliensis]
MMSQVIINIGWSVAFMFIGAIVGTFIIAVAASILPRIINQWSPHMNEEKEILRGNLAVAEYFGRIISAAIIGVSVVVAASVLGGIIAGLHG